MREHMTVARTLPEDHGRASLAGRVWRPDVCGPSVVTVRDGRLVDVTRIVPTMTQLCEASDPAAELDRLGGEDLGPLDAVLANTPEATRDADKPWLLAPIDLAAVKAAGVTFARSMLERVIEEQAKGAPEKARVIRAEVERQLGGDLRRLKPGSAQALALKQTLIDAGAWSQYLEVGIGEDAEIFTKAQPMSAVGHGMEAGLHPRSTWNNPEPEVVLVVASTGRIVGATLGNDVNLRDFEGRSALLLSKAKDNNASASVGPFIRFFDGRFSLDTVRGMDVHLEVAGTDGFKLTGKSSMREIARDPADLVGELIGKTHQYPDGAVLYLGTMFAPTEDRGAPGMGFTHKAGDVVTIRSPALGALVNRMTMADAARPWTFGVAALMRNLALRGLL
ncbi:MAG: fumarylacetoacetate hydrolase family protein [Hyphomicrobiaceae bacterium]|nr:fumarylacetoacetate hydrolase family protein [Hyphomicrobiaceae bacterium]